MERARLKQGLVAGLRVLLRAATITGWGCILLLGLAIPVELFGLPEGWIAKALSARLGPGAGRLQIEDIDLHWTRRGATVRGLTLLAEEEDLRVERLEVQLDWHRGRGLVIESAEVLGADLRISSSLVSGLEGVVKTRKHDGPVELPELVIRGLSISIETPEYGDLAIGELDLAVLKDPRGEANLTGRLAPALGPSSSGFIFLSGEFRGGDMLEVRGAARSLPLTTDFLPKIPTFDPLRQLDPEAEFDLEALATWQLGKDVLPQGRATMALAGGSIALPWLESPESRRVEEIEVAVEVAFEPVDPLSLWSRDAWHAVGRGRASWEEIELVTATRLGRAATEGRLAEAWCHAPTIPLDDRVLDLGARGEWLTDLWDALTPEGSIQASYGFAIPRGWTPDSGVIDTTDRVVAVLPGEGFRVSYVGWPGPDQVTRNQGFPIPLTDLSGRVFYAHKAQRDLAEEVSIYDLTAHTGEDVLGARSSIRFTPGWRRRPEELRVGPELFHLLLESDGISVGDHLRPGFEGLEGVEGCEDLWASYLPSAGRIGLRIELVRSDGSLALLPLSMDTDVRLAFKDLSARWAELPLLCDEINGELRVRGIGRSTARRSATTLDLFGKTGSARGEVRVVGRSEGAQLSTDASRWEVSIGGLDLNGSRLREVVGLREPRVLEGLEAAGVVGTVDVGVTFARPHTGAPSASWFEATPTEEGLNLLPTSFPLEVTGTQGRLLGSWSEAGTSAVAFGLLGFSSAAPGESPVWFEGLLPGDRAGAIRVLGAGIDPLSPAVLEALDVSSSEREGLGLDLSSVDGRGQIDFGAELVLSPEAAELGAGSIALQLRLAELMQQGGDLVRHLRGAITWDPVEGVWKGEKLTAEIGSTPITLTDATLGRNAEGSWVLETGLSAASVPLDREHLSYFVDDRTLRTLLDEFDVRGRFDVDQGTVKLSMAGEGQAQLQFGGQVTVSDLFARIGVPVQVNFARDINLDLQLESGHLRALARVGSLSGEIAGRQLENAQLQLNYIAPRLTIEALDGVFGGGRLRSLGGRGGSTFFAVDLEPPYPFILGGRMMGVEMGQLLRGVFNSSFANQGLLEATIQLRGDLQRLTGIRGGGSFELLDSALWAIPVFQALLSQLGFPSAATFSRMASQYRVEDGVIELPELELKSNLLSLVGGGTIDFDGSLEQDLEVRYALLDQLGPLTRLLYQVQNSLLRISIRGDLSRPEVIVRGLASQFLSAPTEEQRLPLPGFAELPTRF